MKRFLRIAAAALAMFAVMLFSAAITLRIALHPGEVSVPDFSGMTVAEASTAALHNGLDLNIENQFYSTTVPAGRMLSQAPAAGSKVRHGWPVRVTESLGPQQVTIPDVTGEPERVAAIDIRRTALDLGTLAHIAAPGDPDIVLTQSPPPNAGVDQPRVSLLLSSTSGESNALLMPSFLGMSYAAASHAAALLGLHIALPPAPAPTPTPATTPPTAPPATAAPAAAPPEPAAGVKLDAAGEPIAVPAVPETPTGSVTAQSPEPGFRIGRGDAIHLVFDSAPSPNSTEAPSNATKSPSITQ